MLNYSKELKTHLRLTEMIEYSMLYDTAALIKRHRQIESQYTLYVFKHNHLSCAFNLVFTLISTFVSTFIVAFVVIVAFIVIVTNTYSK